MNSTSSVKLKVLVESLLCKLLVSEKEIKLFFFVKLYKQLITIINQQNVCGSDDHTPSI